MSEMDKALEHSTGANTSLLFLTAIDEQWQSYSGALLASKKGLSFDTVHELRTTARRMGVLLKLMQDLQDKPRLKKPIRRLKRQSNDLDTLRDTQVMLKEVEGEIPQMPNLRGFHECLQEQEKRSKRKVKKGFNKLKTGATLRTIVKWIEGLDARRSGELPEKVRGALDEAYQEVEQRYSAVDQTDPTTIHALRVSFRKFRYLVEAMQGLIPGFPAGNVEKMKHYQDRMGEVQDVKVLLQSLADYAAAEADFEPRKAMDYFHHCLDEAICTFLDQQEMVEDFWRSRPDEPFPWEEKG